MLCGFCMLCFKRELLDPSKVFGLSKSFARYFKSCGTNWISHSIHGLIWLCCCIQAGKSKPPQGQCKAVLAEPIYI
eukprot:6462797-Amphidinium_carterae.2